MSFPWDDYHDVLNEAEDIVEDRDQKGRNAVVPFYEGFPHGRLDVSFELLRRVGRILGVEKQANGSPLTPTGVDVLRGDALDLINYAAFFVMLLDREGKVASETPTPPQTLSAPQGAPQ